MNFISDILFWISTGLLVPTVVLLVLFFIRALLLVGGFFGTLLARRKAEAQLNQLLDSTPAADILSLRQHLPIRGIGIVAPFLLRLLDAHNDAPLRERILAQYDIAADADLNLPRTLTKMGPVLGLMGTLIPMGPALVGLSAGDIASMAYNMQVAFATTVVGLVIGAIGTLVAQVKKRWYAADAASLEFVEARLSSAEPSQTVAQPATAQTVAQPAVENANIANTSDSTNPTRHA